MIRFALKVCFGLWMLLPIASCGGGEKIPDGHEAATQTAPDGLSRAFVWIPELGGGLGATVSQSYQVWFQSLQTKKRDALIFEADKTDGVRLAWKAPRELEICYSRAQIVRFHNFFVVAERDSPGIYEVEIVLKKVSQLSDC